MKKIKPIVLKDAKKLTSDEMKNIRGGIAIFNSSSVYCTAQCATGAMKEYVEKYCDKIQGGAVCGIVSDEHETYATCLSLNTGGPLPVDEDHCFNPLPPSGV